MKVDRRAMMNVPCVWMRIHDAVISVVTVKYGSHRSSINVSPNVCFSVWLNSLPLNIEVTGYVRSSIWRHHCVIFCKEFTVVFVVFQLLANSPLTILWLFVLWLWYCVRDTIGRPWRHLCLHRPPCLWEYQLPVCKQKNYYCKTVQLAGNLK